MGEPPCLFALPTPSYGRLVSVTRMDGASSLGLTRLGIRQLALLLLLEVRRRPILVVALQYPLRRGTPRNVREPPRLLVLREDGFALLRFEWGLRQVRLRVLVGPVDPILMEERTPTLEIAKTIFK